MVREQVLLCGSGARAALHSSGRHYKPAAGQKLPGRILIPELCCYLGLKIFQGKNKVPGTFCPPSLCVL